MDKLHVSEAVIDYLVNYNPVEKAYELAIKARDEEDITYLNDIIGYLGEALDG